MGDAQTWTLIAGFLAIVVAMSSLLLRVVTTEIGSLRSEIGGVRTDLSGEIGSLRTELAQAIAPLQAAIARLEVKVDNLDRDVQARITRQFGEGTG